MYQSSTAGCGLQVVGLTTGAEPADAQHPGPRDETAVGCGSSRESEYLEVAQAPAPSWRRNPSEARSTTSGVSRPIVVLCKPGSTGVTTQMRLGRAVLRSRTWGPRPAVRAAGAATHPSRPVRRRVLVRSPRVGPSLRPSTPTNARSWRRDQVLSRSFPPRRVLPSSTNTHPEGTANPQRSRPTVRVSIHLRTHESKRDTTQIDRRTCRLRGTTPQEHHGTRNQSRLHRGPIGSL